MIGVIMVVYQYILVVFDLIHLWVYSIFLMLQSSWYLISPRSMKSVTGETVLITGTGHGIGRELALQFARLGAKVICLDVNEKNNKATVADICREGGTAWGYKCDVSQREEVNAVCRKIQEEIGLVTILVNNAGIMPCKAFMKHTPEEIEKLFSINVFAHFWMIREWLPLFVAAGKGHIVAVSSIAGLMATSNLVPYCSSKYAVKGLMDGLSEELRYAGRHPNIRFTCIHPFVVDTGLAQKPRIRFPYFNPITTTSECAGKIIEGVRREEDIVCIPSKDYYGHKLMNLVPISVRKAFLDFMDTGVDEHDS
ncbi:estradiol 17-beta-dehydrogenase 11-like [Macrobrachium rosenbergii]|uniref:estradiol 17-beta-dehydrogenase 11-like n=1 Tax=Macrobrachium rosenbergii TaxID=79674 RepID=UPI0034D65A96